MTTKVVLVVEYDGASYYGFQFQPNLPTIQGEMERALWQLTAERTRVIAASRTDTGVHARGQIVSFRTSSTLSHETFVSGLNYYLPKDIAVKLACRVEDSFNVRHDALSREYNYYILNSRTRSPIKEGFCYRVAENLDIGVMNQACQALVGEHDFISFASSLEVRVRNTVRRLYRVEIKKDGELVILNMVANSFLPHQVRNTAGALIKVGLGKMNIDEFYNIIKARKPGLAGPTSPARGLCLMRVDYLSLLCGGMW